jgi:16S rRNA (cytosine1402-N4)-methyltransferase
MHLSFRPNEPALPLDDPASNPVHRPVLLEEVVSWLAPEGGSILVDGTVGGGGHASALAMLLGPDGRLIGLDRDPEMLALADRAVEGLPVTLINASYADLGDVLDRLEIDGVDGILLDLGLSSDQLAWSHRGFSFAEDGPLDMRFDPRTRESAADLVNDLDEKELADLIFEYGEERHSRRIAKRIVEARRVEPIVTTARLAEVVRKGVPGKWGAIDPATRTFQALRIAVNGELEMLDDFLANVAGHLNPGGKAAIISFHSLEDRRVKHSFREDPGLTVLTRKPVTATDEELATNPRARSAKLRVAQRCPDPIGPTTPSPGDRPTRGR